MQARVEGNEIRKLEVARSRKFFIVSGVIALDLVLLARPPGFATVGPRTMSQAFRGPPTKMRLIRKTDQLHSKESDPMAARTSPRRSDESRKLVRFW